MTAFAGAGPAMSALRADMEAVSERIRRSVVAVESRRGGGSGTIWRSDGLIATNSHVVFGERARVETGDGRVLEGRVAARDREAGLVLLRVEAEGLPAIEAGDPYSLRAGELVLAVGNPWGEREVLTVGVILNTPRRNGRAEPAMVHADIRLAPGNSGGPLADSRGRAVGINSMVAGGVGMSVPSDAVDRLVGEIGRRPGYLGLTAIAVPGSEETAGLLLTEVTAAGPAGRAGLMPGDLIVGVDGVKGGAAAVADRLRRVVADARLRFDIVRGGAIRRFELVADAAG